ncbi:uncharacterized protein EAE97_005912 [Botrytis byssoidea]|uniref:Calcineurin-like phosphoesterase domain-containing protein n=1 Tax=Botrytis byssoidea TaxID=139641 RepID=A0A9P5IJQ2_9HELO|nr:uncharacterized protein EAE97_005912 [Botrytis byssoidea]KAF7943842.1 hypothetical protein EAE97_005912 [Botrytis byssoidea]
MAAFSHHSQYTHSTRDHLREPPSIWRRLLLVLPTDLAVSLQRMADQQNFNVVGGKTSRIPRLVRGWMRDWSWRRAFSLPHLLVCVWVVVLLSGERWVFEEAVRACAWEEWERWPPNTTPHHLIFLADPQLTDPHSYPDRPWPLSTFTVWHTDNYMKRSYIQLSKQLHPDTIFFLGDLFDGGREWKTAHGNSEDQAWAKGRRPAKEQKHLESWGKRYGEDFWLKEYGRFSRIFSDNWNLGGTEAGVGQRGRKLIASLPGNHDLGFGAQIKVPIRDRFEVYFGDVNRVDVIANHTFVSVDSVSLSAGASERPVSETAPITKPVEEFLNNVQVSKRKAVARELDFQAGKERAIQYTHSVQDVELADYAHLPTLDPGPNGAEFPTILLTHVPLYRNPGTPCGPLREHWPPTPPPKGQTMPVIPDHRNAISVSKGYQYQNVLGDDDSKKLISKIGNVVSIFSGDDHDYCELVHPEDKNHAREITVKSMNWAMGIRKPGFLMLSMWNPVGADGKPLHSIPTGHGAENTHTSTTMESHLCLLPDQIGILINYGILVGISLLLLIIRAILVPFTNLTPFAPDTKGSSSGPGSPIDSEFSLLPTSIKDLKREDEEEKDRRSEGNSSTSSTATVNNLATRTSRTRTSSPANGYGLPGQGYSNGVPYQQTQPLIEKAGYYGGLEGRLRWESEREFEMEMERERKRKVEMERRRNYKPWKIVVWWGGFRTTKMGRVLREIGCSVWRVLWVVGAVFMWFTWFG